MSGTVPLRRLFADVVGGSWGSDPGEDEITIPCVRGTDFDYPHLQVDLQRAPLRSYPLRDIRTRAAVAGDLIIEKSGGGETQPVGRAVLYGGETEVMPTNFAARLRPSREAEPRYLAYLLASLYSGGRTRASIKQSTGIQNLDLEHFLKDRVRWQSVRVQRAFADYLDTETARIDALIAKKRSLARLVSERSQQIQAEMVTGRLHCQELKDSGHAWLGEIPAHWSVERLKFVAKLESGHTPSRTRPELWVDCSVPWVTLNDVGYLEHSEFIEETVNLISTEGLAASSARVLPAQTVVLSRDATVGRCGILSVPMATSQHFVDWICSNRLLPRYLWLLFRSVMQRHFDSLAAGATLRTIGMPDVKRLVVPIPPIAEQSEIVSQAEKVRTRASRTVDALTAQIELLVEHRQALITAVVTGELEIPGVAA